MWLFSSYYIPAKAQSIGHSKLAAWESELVERHTKQHKQTRMLAKTNGWPLSKNYSNQRILKLQGVDPLGQPVYYTLHNTEAAQGTRTQSLYKGGSLQINLSGNSGVMTGRLGLWDGGRVSITHQEFAGSATSYAGRVTHSDKATTVSDHSTHLAGTLVASGIRAEARGMANGATLSVWDFANDIAEITAAAPNLLISNHAYGPVVGWVYNASRPGTDPNLKWEWWGNTTLSNTEDYQFGFYTANAHDIDRVAYNNPFYLMVRSADNKHSETGPPARTAYFLKNTSTRSTVARSHNDAYDVIPAEATAKNVLTVGAARTSFDNNRLTSLEAETYSGWGPTDDGRVKPDLLGIGTDVFSTLSADNTSYGLRSGTSMASANVSGSLFLLQELYAQQRIKAGYTATAGRFLRSASLRGLALHTADRINPAAGPDYKQGWGLLNTEAAARVILNADKAHLILEQTLVSSGTFSYRLVPQGDEPLWVTLCWTDPEGEATPVTATSVNSRTPKLVNDLDLRVAGVRSVATPFVLNPANPGQAATRGDNSRDNVEQVYIANPVAGQTYTVSVTHKGKMIYAGQPFSILVSGLRRSSACQLTAVISPAKDTVICAGTTLALRAATGPGIQYEWLRDGIDIPNAGAPVLAVDKTGSYTLRLTDTSGCSSVSDATVVQVSAVETVSIQPAETDLILLQGAIVTLKAPLATDYTYQWYRNGSVTSKATQPQFPVSQPGVYKVQVTPAFMRGLVNGAGYPDGGNHGNHTRPGNIIDIVS